MTNEEMCQNIESFTFGLDDTFAFHCTQCGKCCIHRTDIILPPRDIFKMAKELKLSNSDFLKKKLLHAHWPHQSYAHHYAAACRK